LKTTFVEIAGPARVYVRDAGAGSPLIFLHGGWGYEVYPFDRQIEALTGQYRIFIPDRSGYGRSPGITRLPPDFHRRAATETMQVMDALEIRQAVLWGHSDGAVIAALMGLATPNRFSALILEAFHYTRDKTGSVDFFRKMIAEPYSAGDRAVASLAQDYGADWTGVLERNATAWLLIVKSGPGDLYDGKLSELAVPALFIHGSRDPRTEPGDLEAIRRELPRAGIRIIDGAGHSPHSEPETANECTRIAAEFLDRIAGAKRS
jgi:pimeloyl-ACP methyl ester carboxylesterase